MSKKLMSGDGWSFEPASDGMKNNNAEVLAKCAHKITIKLEKRKKGKVVTIIGDLRLEPADLKDLAKKLKAACGSGGTTGADHVEIQGDNIAKAKNWLQANGWGLK